MTDLVINSFGDQFWYYDNKLHRTSGPAVIYISGEKYWYINNKKYRNNKSYKEAAKLSDEDMLMITLKYGNVK